MAGWTEIEDGEGVWRSYHLQSFEYPKPRLVSCLSLARNDAPNDVAIGWTAKIGFNTLIETASKLIEQLAQTNPSVPWTLHLKGYGEGKAAGEYVGEPGLSPNRWMERESFDQGDVLSFGSLQDAASTFINNFSNKENVIDGGEENVVVRDEENVIVRADAMARSYKTSLHLSLWAKPHLNLEAARAMPYGNFSIKTAVSTMDQLQKEITRLIADTIVGGADLAEVLWAVRSSIKAPPPRKMAA